MTKSQCPKCGSNEFISSLNKYDCLNFVDNNFQIQNSKIVDDEYKIYCRGCGAEIDEKKSLKKRKIIVKI